MLTNALGTAGLWPYSGSVRSTSCQTEFIDVAAIEKSDWVQIVVGNLSSFNDLWPYYLWVNGTTLSSFYDPDVSMFNNPPTSAFPYTRLAATTTDGSTAFYLYHQINESIIAEDVWDRALGSWSSSTINIATA